MIQRACFKTRPSFIYCLSVVSSVLLFATIYSLKRTNHSRFSTFSHTNAASSKICVPKESFYYGIITHNGNLPSQMKFFHDNIIHSTNHSLYLKKNTFYATDDSVSEEDSALLYGMSPLVFNKNANYSSYMNAQYRFLATLREMSELEERRNDTNVRWFVLADDDFFHIPRNFYRVLAKYDWKVKHGVLNMSDSLIIGRTNDCGTLSGGASVIFNKPAVNLVLKYIYKCIDKSGMEWYDYSIYMCLQDVIAQEEYSANTTESNLKARCNILQMESSMNCCYFPEYCDPVFYDHYYILSWFERFRLASGFHYIKGQDRYNALRSFIPDRYFTGKEYCFTKEELENDFYGIAEPTMNLETNLTLQHIIDTHKQIQQPPIDWSVNESNQKDPSAVNKYMEQVHSIIFTNWRNHGINGRPVVVHGHPNDIDVVVIPSSSLLEFQTRMAPDYKPTERFAESEGYWKSGIGTDNVFICQNASGNQRESIFQCLKEKPIRETKWTLVVTESTRADVGKISNYVSTFDPSKKYFLASFASAQEIILSKQDVSLPFASGFVISKPFLENYLELNNDQLGINELMKPNEVMVLSAGQFFLHPPEYYCANGIQNLKSWVEMKLKTNLIDPFLVTFSPTYNCKERWTSIANFFNNMHHSVCDGKQLFAKCYD